MIIAIKDPEHKVLTVFNITLEKKMNLYLKD